MKYKIFAYFIIVLIFLVFTFHFLISFFKIFDIILNFSVIGINILIALFIASILILIIFLISKSTKITKNKLIRPFIYVIILLFLICWSQYLIFQLGYKYSLIVKDLIKDGFYIYQIFYAFVASLIIILILFSTSISAKKKVINEI